MKEFIEDPHYPAGTGQTETAGGDLYEIHLTGCLNKCWSDWLDGMKISHIREGETMLSGWVPDQPALFGLLMKIRDLNMKLLLVKKVG